MLSVIMYLALDCVYVLCRVVNIARTFDDVVFRYGYCSCVCMLLWYSDTFVKFLSSLFMWIHNSARVTLPENNSVIFWRFLMRIGFLYGYLSKKRQWTFDIRLYISQVRILQLWLNWIKCQNHVDASAYSRIGTYAPELVANNIQHRFFLWIYFLYV